MPSGYNYNIQINTKVKMGNLSQLNSQLEKLDKYRNLTLSITANTKSLDTLGKKIQEITTQAGKLDSALDKIQVSKNVDSSITNISTQLDKATKDANELKTALSNIKSVNAKVNVSTNSSGVSSSSGGRNYSIYAGGSSSSSRGTASKDRNLYLDKSTGLARLSTDYANVGSKGSSFREKFTKTSDLALGMTGLIGMSGLKGYLYDTPVKADTNKYIVKGMGDDTLSGDQLYDTVDQVTNKYPISMQDIIQPLNAFQSATGSTANEIQGITDQFANFGAVVLNLTGSEDLATTAMQKLSYGIQGNFAALDQYGVTENSLKSTGLWDGDETDIEGFMAAVTQVVGDASGSMMTFNGQSQQLSKNLSIAGKYLWTLNSVPLTASLGVINGLDEATGGTTTILGLFAGEIFSLGTTLIGTIGYTSQFASSLADFVLYLRQIQKGGGLLTTFKQLMKGMWAELTGTGSLDDELLNTLAGTDSTYALNNKGTDSKKESDKSSGDTYISPNQQFKKEWRETNEKWQQQRAEEKRRKKLSFAQLATLDLQEKWAKRDKKIKAKQKSGDVAFSDEWFDKKYSNKKLGGKRKNYAKRLADRVDNYNQNRDSSFWNKLGTRSKRTGLTGIKDAWDVNTQRGGVRSTFQSKGATAGFKNIASGLGGVIGQVGTSLTSLVSGINPVTAALVALGAAAAILVTMFTYAYNNIGQFKDRWNLFMAKVNEFGGSLKVALGNFFNAIGLSSFAGTKGFEEGIYNTCVGILQAIETIMNITLDILAYLPGNTEHPEAEYKQEPLEEDWNEWKKENGYEGWSDQALVDKGVISTKNGQPDDVDNSNNPNHDDTAQNIYDKYAYYNKGNLNGWYAQDFIDDIQKSSAALYKWNNLTKEQQDTAIKLHSQNTEKDSGEILNDAEKGVTTYQTENQQSSSSTSLSSSSSSSSSSKGNAPSWDSTKPLSSLWEQIMYLNTGDNIETDEKEGADKDTSDTASDQNEKTTTNSTLDVINSNVAKIAGNTETGSEDTTSSATSSASTDEKKSKTFGGTPGESPLSGVWDWLNSYELTSTGSHGGLSIGGIRIKEKDSSDKKESTESSGSASNKETKADTGTIVVTNGQIAVSGTLTGLNGLNGTNGTGDTTSNYTSPYQNNTIATTPSSSQVQSNTGSGQQASQNYTPSTPAVDTSTLETSLANSIKTAIQNGINQGFSTLSTSVSAKSGDLTSVGITLGTNLTSGFQAGITNLTSEINSKISTIGSTIRGQSGTVRSAGQALGNAAKTGFQTAMNGLSQIASTEASGIATAILSHKNEVYQAGYTLGQASQEGYKKGGGISSPGYAWRAAEAEFKGLSEAIRDKTDSVYNSSFLVGKAQVEGYKNHASITALNPPQINSANIGGGAISSDVLRSVAVESISSMRSTFKGTEQSRGDSSTGNTPVNVTNHFDVASIDSKDRVQEVAEGVVKVLRFNNETAGRLDSNSTGNL